MAVGQNSNVGFNSYLLVGREATFKTYNTCTAALEFMSASFVTKKEIKQIEAVRKSRTFADKIGLGKVVEGEIEFAIGADDNASQYILQNAMGGGTISSATAAGDTVGGGLFEHVYSISGFDSTYSSLCFNHRKGDATNGKTFEYSGARVNELTLKAEIDEPLVASAKVICVDSTSGGADLSANVTNNNGQVPLVFTNMRFSVESTFAALTTSSYWHVQSIEVGMNNNLKADADSRRIGSDLLQILPPGTMALSMSVSMRFDTLTAYAAMMAETQLAAQVEFLQVGNHAGSNLAQGIRVDFPRIYISDAGDPEIGGPDEVIKSDVSFLILQDDSSATGYACKVTARNATSTYA